jgi:hypothetical protein
MGEIVLNEREITWVEAALATLPHTRFNPSREAP